MGIWDSLFGTKKGPVRGRASSDDDAEASPADFTRTIRRDELAQRAAPSDDWDAPTARAGAPAESPGERAPASPPPAHSLPRRAAPPPPPVPAPRAYAPPAPAFDDDEPPPTEYAKVARAAVLKVAAVLVGVEGPLEGHVIRIYQGENILGREAEPEPKDSVPSTAASISRKHAKLIADGGYFVLEPVQLKNATLVAGAPIDAHAVLQHGDRISLGTAKPCTFVLLAVPA
jgi:hypothetical protein